MFNPPQAKMETDMDQHEANIVIHVNETLDVAGLTGLETALCTDARARSAWHHEAHGHLLVVHFDPEMTCAAELLDAVTSRGLHAQLIGL